jgi:hypothetical protein
MEIFYRRSTSLYNESNRGESIRTLVKLLIVSSMLVLAAAYAPENPTSLENEIIAAVNRNDVRTVKAKIDILAADISTRTSEMDPFVQATFSVVISLTRHKQTPNPECMATFMNLYWKEITQNTSANDLLLLQIRVERWAKELPQTKGLARMADKLYLEVINKTPTSKQTIERTLTEIERHKERYLSNRGALRSLFFKGDKLILSERFPEAKAGDIWLEILAKPMSEVLDGNLIEKIHEVIPLRREQFAHFDRAELLALDQKLGAYEDEIVKRSGNPEYKDAVPGLKRQFDILNACMIEVAAKPSTNWFVSGCTRAWNALWKAWPKP